MIVGISFHDLSHVFKCLIFLARLKHKWHDSVDLLFMGPLVNSDKKERNDNNDNNNNNKNKFYL